MSPSVLPRLSTERQHPGASSGFTLIEVLVAISMVATVLAAIYGIFTSISSASLRLEAEGEANHRARVIFDRFGREIRGASPIGGADGNGIFRGGKDANLYPYLEMTTTAVAQQIEGGTGISLVRYSLTRDREKPDGKTLVLERSEQPALGRRVAEAGIGPLRLAPGIEQLQLRYYNGNEWLDDWDARNGRLPALVELSLVMIDSQGHSHQFVSAFELPGVTWKK